MRCRRNRNRAGYSHSQDQSCYSLSMFILITPMDPAMPSWEVRLGYDDVTRGLKFLRQCLDPEGIDNILVTCHNDQQHGSSCYHVLVYTVYHNIS